MYTSLKRDKKVIEEEKKINNKVGKDLSITNLKDRIGKGGFSSSLAKPKTKPKPKPPKAGAFKKQMNYVATEFKRFYDRGDLPLMVDFEGAMRKVNWKIKPDQIEKLDYQHYLPIFFHGLREKHEPYKFLALEGLKVLLDKGKHCIYPVVPQLIIPIKLALNTRDPEIICKTLKVLQDLVKCPMVGKELIPYYRQILPIFNLFINHNVNSGDAIDYGQQKKENLGDLIEETLAAFEEYGQEGDDDAFINIKYMIPTYESHCYNGP